MPKRRRHKTPSDESLERMEPCKWAKLPDNYYDPKEVQARANCRALIDGTLDTDAYLSFEQLHGRK